MKINFKKLSSDAIIPEYKTAGSAGMDLHITESAIVGPGGVTMLKTGLCCEVPGGNVVIKMYLRSSMAKQGFIMPHAVGIIDSDYRGEIRIPITNLQQTYELKAGTRIAQLLIERIDQVEIAEVSELGDTVRGDGGFGSTGE